MAHRRMLSKRICQSKKVNKLSIKAQLIFTWQLPFLDDYGCYIADPEDIKTEVFPKNEQINEEDINAALGEMAGIELIYLYKYKDKYYQCYLNFFTFQTFRSDRKKVSDYPQYKDRTEDSAYQGNPWDTNDACKLSKDKISKDKISKDKEEVVHSKGDTNINSIPKPSNLFIKIIKEFKEFKIDETKDRAWLIEGILNDSEYKKLDIIKELQNWGNWLEGQHRIKAANQRHKFPVIFKNSLRNWLKKALEIQKQRQGIDWDKI